MSVRPSIYSNKTVIFFKAKVLQSQQSESARNQTPSSFYAIIIPEILMMTQSKNEKASIETKLQRRHHFHIISLRDILIHSRAAKAKVNGRNWPKFELIQDCMNVFLTCKFKKNQLKAVVKKWRHRFFTRSRAANSIVSCPIWPKFELVCAPRFNACSYYMKVSKGSANFSILSLWGIYRRSRAANSEVSGPIWLKCENMLNAHC